MLAGFAAAYMSTIGTQLNWGASYLINDVYKRFLRPHETEHHYVSVSRVATVLLFLMSIVVAWQISSIEQAWKFLIAVGAGTGLVYMLRWYWWRINAWSEISAMLVSLAVAIVALRVVPHHFAPGDPNADASVMLVTVGLTTVVWITVTWLTPAEPDAILDSFYRRVRPGGPGWRAVAQRAGFGAEPLAVGRGAWLNWIAGIVAAYATLFGIGKLIFGPLSTGFIMLAVAAVAFAWIARSFRQETPPDLRAVPGTGPPGGVAAD
jgi:Na+/proline symporter